uniref:Peptidase S1 domain-containing protein n=1 Tax=Acrobeloides nanus TaxID=290746 RepID=A0A914DI40_9BILA
MKSKELSEVVHNISLIHVHPKYNPDDITNDIAVLEVDPEIKFTNRVQPVCLPSSDESQTADQEIGWVTGWGTTSENGRVSNRLKQADVPFVSAQKCNEHQSIQKKIQICAGEAGEDACQGDSGGPLVKENKYNHWFQYGVVSNGIGCARAEFPGIYTRVSTFCSFIRSATNNHVSCHNPNHFRD